MSDATTIKLECDVKRELDKENLDGETYSETVARLLGNSKGQVWTEQEIKEIAERVVEEHARH